MLFCNRFQVRSSSTTAASAFCCMFLFVAPSHWHWFPGNSLYREFSVTFQVGVEFLFLVSHTEHTVTQTHETHFHDVRDLDLVSRTKQVCSPCRPTTHTELSELLAKPAGLLGSTHQSTETPSLFTSLFSPSLFYVCAFANLFLRCLLSSFLRVFSSPCSSAAAQQKTAWIWWSRNQPTTDDEGTRNKQASLLNAHTHTELTTC